MTQELYVASVIHSISIPISLIEQLRSALKLISELKKRGYIVTFVVLISEELLGKRAESWSGTLCVKERKRKVPQSVLSVTAFLMIEREWLIARFTFMMSTCTLKFCLHCLD